MEEAIKYMNTLSSSDIELYKNMYKEFEAMYDAAIKDLTYNVTYNISLLYKKYYEKSPSCCKYQIQILKEIINNEIGESKSGMYIGEGWHGGCTREEWKEINMYLIRAQNIIDTLKYEL
jgi:hypothetical protein